MGRLISGNGPRQIKPSFRQGLGANFLQKRDVAGPAEPPGKVPLHLANFSALEADQASGAT
jgi:hypothetical protein